MKRILLAVLLTPLLAVAASAGPLEIFFIDVEGGASTLIVTPTGQTLLIDAGYGSRAGRDPATVLAAGGRDPSRILAAAAAAGVDRIDYLLITHFHNDHVGGVPELASRIPIGTFIDYGAPLGSDRMARGGFSAYAPVRGDQPHIQPRPGDQLPLDGLEATVVSAGGDLLPGALPGAGATNEACAGLEHHAEDGTENFRSLGVLLRFGEFRFVALGDLSGNTLGRLVCPRNLVGETSVYLVAHHGDYDTNLPALYAALRPRVAIMNNGVTKGGAPEAFRTLAARPEIEDVWQLHASQNRGAANSPDELIANLDAHDNSTGYWIRLTALEDGSFRIVNGRTGFTKTYSPVSRDEQP